MTRGKEMKMNQEWSKQELGIRNWFGDRGFDIDERRKLKFEIFKGFVFIVGVDGPYVDDFDPTEVFLYELDSLCAEIYTSWPVKGFQWEKDIYLRLLIKLGLIKQGEDK